MKMLVESLKRMYKKGTLTKEQIAERVARVVFQRMNMNISQEKNSPAVIQNESA